MSISFAVLCLAFMAVPDEPVDADTEELRAMEGIVLRGHKGAVTRVAFYTHDRWNMLVSSGEDGSVFLWNLNQRDPAPVTLADFGNVPVWALDYRRSDGLVASGHDYQWGAQVKLVHPQINQQEPLATLGDFKRGGGNVWCLAFGPGRTPYLAVGTKDNVIRIWAVNSRPARNDKGNAVIQVTEGLAGAGRAGVHALAFSPNSRDALLAAGTWQGSIQLFRVVARPRFGLEESGPRIDGHGNPVTRLCFSPDGQRLASSSHDGTIAIWDVNTGSRTLLLRGPKGHVNYIDYSPDGTLLASAHDDGSVRIWDPGTGDELLVIRAHDQPVLCSAFAPDGRRLASASRDHTIKGWVLSGPGIPEPDQTRR